MKFHGKQKNCIIEEFVKYNYFMIHYKGIKVMVLNNNTLNGSFTV